MLEKTRRMNRLYDYYSALLTDKQREYLDLYYREDYSLGEIAELLSVSRQAVYDNIHRSEKTLLQYEDKLGLLKADDARREAGQELLRYARETGASAALIAKIEAFLAR